MCSNIFLPHRSLGYVSNHIPLKVRYIKSRQENLIVTCVGKAFHTYGISHFSLLTVSSLHDSDIKCLASDTYHVYTSCGKDICAYRRGTELKHTYYGHKNDVHILLPFGVHLISIDIDSNLKVWDIKNESCSLELSFSNDSFKITTCIHPHTYINKILLGSSQGGLQLWNINTSMLVHTFTGWGEAVTALEAAPAIDIVAVGLANGKIYLHNLKFDETIIEFTQDWGLVTSISFRTDNTSIMVTGSTVGHIVLWDLDKRRVASQLLNAHDDFVTGLECLQNEPLMISSSPDNSLKLWIFDMPDGGPRLLRIREGHSGSPTNIRFHGANGDNILSSGGDSTLRIFNTKTEQFNKSFGKSSYNRKLSKKRGRLVEDTLTMPPITQFTSETTREKEWDNIVALHSGIPMVTTWSYDKIKMGELKLIPEKFYRKNSKFLEEHIEATCVTLTHCGNFVVVGYSTGDLERFNIQSGLWKCSYGSPKAHSLAIRGVAVDVLNEMAVSGSSDGFVKFWKFNAIDKTPIKLNLDSPIHLFKLQRETSMLAVALEDFSVNIIDLGSCNIIRKFDNHSGQINDVTFTPDSRWLITASMDCTIKTWDIPTSYLIDEFHQQSACISLDMSPCGDILATAHMNELEVNLWCNKTVFEHTDLKALSLIEDLTSDTKEDILCQGFSLIKLSGVPLSRWQNLLNMEMIKLRNKPKMPPKARASGPFFLPTIPSLTFQFNLNNNTNGAIGTNGPLGSNEPMARNGPLGTNGPIGTDGRNGSKIINNNLSIYPKLTPVALVIQYSIKTNDLSVIAEKLKTLPPSSLNFEICTLNDYGDDSIALILQFLKMCEFMFKRFKDFELINSYYALLLKHHGKFIAKNNKLRFYLSIIDSSPWPRLKGNIMYCISIIKNKI